MRLTIEKAVYGGAGLARAEGKAVFVPMALAGETVEVGLRRDKGSFAEAELVEVVSPSPDRVAAPCPYYGACGGCQYQHAGYTAQLAMKRGILLETLGRAGLRDVPEVTVHAGEPWGYRNRIRLHVDAASHALGYRRKGSHMLLAIRECPIAAPLLERALAVLRDVFAKQEAGGWCGEVELFMNGDSSALLLSFMERPGAVVSKVRLERLCEAVRERVPVLAGAGLFAASRARAGGWARVEDEGGAGARVAAWGEPGLEYSVGGERYMVSLGAFFQGNRYLVERLRTLATEGADGAVVWDLFAGVGLFARAVAERFEKVVAVEGAPVAAGDLRRNLVGSGAAGARHRAVESSALDFLSRGARGGKAPDWVVLDPPRAGLGAEASALLGQVRSHNVTYVSCDPATLSRDLRVLVDAGYTITRLDLIDMFPQTFHLETVVRLSLR